MTYHLMSYKFFQNFLEKITFLSLKYTSFIINFGVFYISYFINNLKILEIYEACTNSFS